MKRFWLSVGLFLVVLSSSFTALTVLTHRTAEAAAGFQGLYINARFIDEAHIIATFSGTYTTDTGDVIKLDSLSGMYYTDDINHDSDNNYTYSQGGSKQVGVVDGCQSKVSMANVLGLPPSSTATTPGPIFSKWTLSLPPTGTTGTKCITEDLPADAGPNAPVVSTLGTDNTTGSTRYYISDLTHINESDNDPTYDSKYDVKNTLTKISPTATISTGDQFRYDHNSPKYGGSCPNYIQITADQGANSVFPAILQDQNGSSNCTKTGTPLNEYVLANTPLAVSQGDINPPTTGDAGSSQDPNAAIDDKCPLTSDWQLKYLACPIIDAINDFVNSMSQEIQNDLLLPVDNWFGTSPSATAIATAFNSFRVLGLSVLIAAAVAMVASQASGFEALDALTIRRFMPQFVVSVIIISILLPLEKAAVQVVNELSLWVPDAMYAPFTHLHNGSNINAIDGWSLLTLLLSAGGGLVVLGPFGFLSFLLTAFMALVVAAVTITIVQMAILGSLIAMPLAVAFRPIPNLKFIWDFVIKIAQGGAVFTILVPITFALGKVLAILVPTSYTTASLPEHHGLFGQMASIFGLSAGGVGNGFLSSVAIFGAIVGPYIGIPKIAQSSVGAIGTLTGMVNDKGKGMFDRLSKFRGGQIQKRGQAWKSGSLYQDKGVFRSGINSLGRRVNIGPKGLSPFHRAQAGQLLSMQQAVDAENAGKSNPLLAQLAQYDDGNAVLALSGGNKNQVRAAAERLFTTTDARTGVSTYNEARGAAAIAAANGVGVNRANSAYAFKSMMQNKARAIGAGDIQSVEMGARNLAGGNEAMFRSLMYDAAYNARGSGRNDLGGVSIDLDPRTIETVYQNARRNNARGRDGRSAVTREDVRSHMTAMDGMGRTQVAQIMNGHTNQAVADTRAIQFMRQNGTGELRDVARLRANEIAKSLSQSNGDGQAEFNRFVTEDLGVDTSSPVGFSQQLARIELGAGATDDDIIALSNTIENGSRTYGNENQMLNAQQNQNG